MAAILKKHSTFLFPHRRISIRRRWIYSNVVFFASFVLLAVLMFSLFIAGYYFNSVETSLRSKAQTATDFFSNYVTSTYSGYYDSAYKYAGTFEDASTIELQFINVSGRVMVSSYGVTAGVKPGTDDISDAINSGKISGWRGRDKETNEYVMAVSAPLIYSNGQIIGVMRYVTSLKLVSKAVMNNVLLALGIGFLVILIVLMTNLMFIRTVVRPIQEMTGIARKIADGSYGVKINSSYPYEDELSDLVRAINDMSMKIGQAEKTQTEFISSISHELRTPLTAINGWGETLMYDDTLTEDSKKGIAIIQKEARRLTKMVEELLEFTRMQDGRFTLNVEEIDVGAELEEAIFTYGELLKQESLQLCYEPYDDELPLINGDPARLRQVFLNILDNAAKYGREGKRIIVSMDTDMSFVYVRIRDFGPGVPEDELERVKMKFYKGNSKERGSGIGLAVCDEIVKYHGGELILKNAEGGGLEVTIKLPALVSGLKE